MPIFAATKSNYDIINSDQGLSLIEILIAIFLIALASFTVIRNPFNPRADLEEAVYGIERSIKLASQEAILKNKVTRLKFIPEVMPHEYLIEVGQHHDILLPEVEEQDQRFQGDQKLKEKLKEEFDAGFAPLDEFKRMAKPLKDDILFIGLITDYNPVITHSESSIYFFPIGHRDAGIIFLASVDELIAIYVNSVREEIITDYHLLENSTYSNFEAIARKKARDIAQVWINENR